MRNPSPVAELDGVWNVKRTGGLLPPMLGVRKRISGPRGVTTVGPVRARFDVVGRELRYRAPFVGLVDVLTPAGDSWSGRALFAGRQYGRFRLTPIESADTEAPVST